LIKLSGKIHKTKEYLHPGTKDNSKYESAALRLHTITIL